MHHLHPFSMSPTALATPLSDACLLPSDIQNLPTQSTSCGSIKSSEHYFDTSGNDGEGNTADIRAVTGHQQAAVCPQTVHVVLCACVHVCLMDQLTLRTVDYTAVTLHVVMYIYIACGLWYVRSFAYSLWSC